MNTLMSILLVLVIALPVLSLAMIPASGSSILRAARTGGVFNGLGFLLATILTGWVSSQGPISVELNSGFANFAVFHADRLVVVLLMLVTGLSAVVQTFSGRYLLGDLRGRRFFAGANLLTAATAAMVASATLIGLAAAWTIAGLALLLLLGMYPGLASAEVGLRRTAKSFLIGDLALWSGVLIATLEWGSLDLRSLDGNALTGGNGDAVLSVVACLLVVAALSRSAQIPFQTWLPATLAVPTPVSALLHAGVVNAGGILLVRTSPLFGESPVATHLAFFLGAATTAYGIALMLSKPDVKGALAHSTTGQMGFMIMTCGLGAWPAAIFHLVAHGMFKASLFLGSGSAVNQRIRNLARPPRPEPGTAGRLTVILFSLLMPALVLLVASMSFYPDLEPAAGALLIFAWATAAWATHGWLARRPGPGGMLIAAATVAFASSVYVAALGAATAFLDPTLVLAGESTVNPWWLAIFLPALLVASPLARSSVPAIEFRKNVYVLALGAAQVRPAASKWKTRLPFPSAPPVGSLTTDSQGAQS